MRANTTDPQARTVRSKNTMIVGYNAQAVVTLDQIIVGVALTPDGGHGVMRLEVLPRCGCSVAARTRLG